MTPRPRRRRLPRRGRFWYRRLQAVATRSEGPRPDWRRPMRKAVLGLAVLLGAAGLAPAQTTPADKAAPAAPAPNAAADARLDAYLQRWEQEMRKVQTLAAILSREDKDKTFNTKTEFVG